MLDKVYSTNSKNLLTDKKLISNGTTGGTGGQSPQVVGRIDFVFRIN